MEVEASTEENAVEVIREGVRELVSAERKENRLKVLNKNRVALGYTVLDSSFTPKFVVEQAEILKKKPLPIERYKQLQNALIQNEENVNAFLKVNNILFALSRDFSGNNPIIQLCAISCACNIALGNTKACTSLAKSIGSYLTTGLDSLNYPLVEVSIWTMGNLIAGSNKAFEIFHAQSCLKHIISLMQNCDNMILSAVAYCAMHYVRVGFQHISENEMVELTRVTTERSLSFERSYMIWLLALLSSQEPCNIYVYNVVPLIVDYLHQSIKNNYTAVTEITACIRILANTVQETSGKVAKLFLENLKCTQLDVETLLNGLLSCQYVHIRKETLWLIGNLYNHNVISIKNTIRNIIPKLPSMKQAISSATQQSILVNADQIS
ncbi:uncharacterized protein LOC114873428 isoform X1 [Osmia bicornis bicornis]|uniref:uncharacterized protein LOC114873428 isoform X1 n=1 Tax=Osmia bicornis bicornis TaxID=1437191 RepID=UPI001EAF705B|nr:uncharacterized protein LOC114873428 isoform X1 [Osmia bicornis bicornis]XP_029037578.2 uncharacterized protein LOC114873428 isoform X1 [Osmia bicornis bicornis]